MLYGDTMGCNFRPFIERIIRLGPMTIGSVQSLLVILILNYVGIYRQYIKTTHLSFSRLTDMYEIRS